MYRYSLNVSCVMIAIVVVVVVAVVEAAVGVGLSSLSSVLFCFFPVLAISTIVPVVIAVVVLLSTHFYLCCHVCD